jgi:hypothetical protein
MGGLDGELTIYDRSCFYSRATTSSWRVDSRSPIDRADLWGLSRRMTHSRSPIDRAVLSTRSADTAERSTHISRFPIDRDPDPFPYCGEGIVCSRSPIDRAYGSGGLRQLRRSLAISDRSRRQAAGAPRLFSDRSRCSLDVAHRPACAALCAPHDLRSIALFSRRAPARGFRGGLPRLTISDRSRCFLD